MVKGWWNYRICLVPPGHVLFVWVNHHTLIFGFSFCLIDNAFITSEGMV